jgi:ferredoxin--NADP+ reductase
MPTLKVIDNRPLSDHTYILRTERPPGSIKAGQCFSLGTSDLGINREYSMYSSAQDNYVDFMIRKVPEGRVSNRLSALNTGDEIQLSGPYGEFCLPEDEIQKSTYLFIASGTGIAPFHSFASSYPLLNYRIIHGVRFENETYDNEVYARDRYFPCISQPNTGNQGQRVTDFLLNNSFNTDTKVYLCGNRNMIVDAIEILRTKGFSGDSIFTEAFF